MSELIQTKQPQLRKARLGHFYDGEHRINVVFEAGRLVFNRHKSRKVTSAGVPLMELYHASIGQLPLPAMEETWGMKAPEVRVEVVTKTTAEPMDGPIQDDLIP